MRTIQISLKSAPLQKLQHAGSPLAETGWKPVLRHEDAFTLIELLVTIGIIGVLSGLIYSGVTVSMQKAKGIQCVSKLHQLGGAMLLYANDNNGVLAVSMHGAGFTGLTKWTEATAPYLGIQLAPNPDDTPPSVSTADFERFYRCPTDPCKCNTNAFFWSYGLNAYFDLNLGVSDRLVLIPHPARTILLAELRNGTTADHFMPELFTSLTGAKTALAYNRHSGLSNYLFLDGHVESLTIDSVYSPSGTPNLFNPSLAQ